MRSLREKIADAEDRALIAHFDPESHHAGGSYFDYDDAEKHDDAGDFTGREHYETVDQSKLRKPVQPVLGEQYQGKTVRRDAFNVSDEVDDDPFAPVDDESDGDPFAKRANDESSAEGSIEQAEEEVNKAVAVRDIPESELWEIDSDEALGSEDLDDITHFKFSGSKRPPLRGEGRLKNDSEENGENDTEESGDPSSDSDIREEEIDNEEEAEVDVDVGGTDSEELNDAGDGSTFDEAKFPTDAAKGALALSDRATLKALLSNDTAAVASSLSAAASADVKKGRAVKQQYHMFDRLLDARIKLQKGLNAVNDFTKQQFEQEDLLDAARKAEEAALTLWTTIESIRQSFQDAQQSSSSSISISKKRKRAPPVTAATTTNDIWTRSQGQEATSVPYRRAILDKWSAKARASAALPAPRAQLSNQSNVHNDSISSILDNQLAIDSEKLVAAVTSSPARKTGNNGTQPTSLPIYDDTLFYQSLLRDLISSRSSISATSTITSVLPSTTKLHPSGSKNKTVDTKASKGRKVRYTVHEKLQNFAAEEERGTWEESARREFFGSLFGGTRRALNEDEGLEGGMDDVIDVVDKKVEALRLFRN